MAEDEAEAENDHRDLEAYVRRTHHDNTDICEDYKAYCLNLKKYGKIVPPAMRTRPMFKFLCFILNERHKSRCISAHYGCRFDNLIALQFLLLMGITPKILAQGQGVLQLIVTEWDVVFIDSFKFFPQKLESLPYRFQLEQFKGYFAFSFNPPKNWGRKRKNPPELSSYITDKDSDATKADKTKWWHEEKSQAPRFLFNLDCIKYCQQDVHVLMASCLKFLTQAFQFGQQMIDTFGTSPAYKEGLHHPHFLPLTKSTPTLGSYA